MTSRAGAAERAGADLRTRGFTLFELIVVLLILAVSAAFVGPAVQSGWQSREIRQGTRKVAAVMRGLRERAVRTGVEQELVLVNDGKTLRWTDGESVVLPDAAWITGVRGGWIDQDGNARLVFYANGGSSGIALSVGTRGDDGLRLAIEVDPLLGSVVIQDATR